MFKNKKNYESTKKVGTHYSYFFTSILLSHQNFDHAQRHHVLHLLQYS